MTTGEPPLGTVVYVLLDFPVPSERFIEREVRALRQLGLSIHILTLRPATGAGTAADPQGLPIWRQPPWWDPQLWIRALRASLKRPSATLRLLGLASAVGSREGAWGRLRALRWAPAALDFAHRLRRHRAVLIHAHFASAPATVALLLAWWMNLPWGFSSHASDIYAEAAHLSLKARRANHVTACSEVLAEDIQRRLPGDLCSRVHTVHHGLDLQRWQRAEPPALHVAEPLILGVGRFEPKKGFAVLIEACAQLRDAGFRFRCELIGAGTQEPHLAQRIAVRRLDAQVLIRPWLSPQLLRQAYTHAAVLAVPSVIAADGNRDNIPNVLLEALACEIPVVASALPGIARILQPSQAARLVEPGDPSALARAIREICSDDDLSRRLRVHGRRLVEEHFDQAVNVRCLHDLFAQSASRGAIGTAG